jgi:hypothetical protein
MKTSLIYISTLCFALSVFCGCSARSSANFDLDLHNIDKEMEKQGWTHLETLGEPGPGILETELDASTAERATAFWILKGQRNEKVYKQTKMLYAVVTIQKADGDTFCLVFTKEKPPKPNVGGK